jgi:hypothetical protein
MVVINEWVATSSAGAQGVGEERHHAGRPTSCLYRRRCRRTSTPANGSGDRHFDCEDEVVCVFTGGFDRVLRISAQLRAGMPGLDASLVSTGPASCCRFGDGETP